jgi:hypothetical protein
MSIENLPPLGIIPKNKIRIAIAMGSTKGANI